MIEILIDESIERIDKKSTKVNVCCVESEEASLEELINELKKTIDQDNIRFPKKQKKLHFSEMNQAQMSIIVETISKLPIRVKVYSFYSISKSELVAKRESVIGSINHLMKLHKNKEIKIEVEHAEEYKRTELEKYLSKDLFKFLLPDAFLSVYGNHLKEIRRTSTSSNAQFYALLRPKIRLQTFFAEEHSEYLTREERV